MRRRACLLAAALLVVPAAPGAGQTTAVTIENPLTVRTAFPPDDATLPAVVAATALPRIRSTVASSPSLTVSEDSRLERSALGPDVLPDAPFPWLAGLRVQCTSEEVSVVNDGDFLGGYANWSALPAGASAPDGWQGTHVSSYYQGGAVVFPAQPDRPGGRMVARDHLLSEHPILPRSSCGNDFDSRLNIDFHRVTLSAEDGDVSFKGGDELGEVRMRMLPAWQGSIFGWFDPPGKSLETDWRAVTNPQTGAPELSFEVSTARSGRWRESLPTPVGPTWTWSASGFSFFGAAEEQEEEAAAEATASLRVLPGQRVVHLWPEGGRIERREYVSPGLGMAVLAAGVVRFENIVSLPPLPEGLRSHTSRRRSAEDGDGAVDGNGGQAGPYCTRSIDRHWEESRLCMGMGSGPGGFSGLTHLSIDDHVQALTAGLTHLDANGVRRELRPQHLVDGPSALEYQYESGSGQDPGTVLSLSASYALGDARFTVSWLFINDAFYGRLLIPVVWRFRSPTASGVRFSWHVRPTLEGRANTAIHHGWSGARVSLASSHPSKGGFFTGSEWFSIRDAETGTDAYYVPSGAGHRWSGLAWASHDSTTTFMNWTGQPTATPLTDALDDGFLGPDVAIHKQDFYESFYMARAYGGSYGMLLASVPFEIGFP